MLISNALRTGGRRMASKTRFNVSARRNFSSGGGGGGSATPVLAFGAGVAVGAGFMMATDNVSGDLCAISSSARILNGSWDSAVCRGRNTTLCGAAVLCEQPRSERFLTNPDFGPVSFTHLSMGTH